MSEIVCQVGSQAGQVELIWSSHGGFFRPYTVSGVQLAELHQAADQTRAALEGLVYALNRQGTGSPWERSYELADAGFRLFNYLLPTEDDTARKVRRWLEGVRKDADLIGLEVVVEEQSGDPKAFLSVPWNLVYDELPDEDVFREEQGAERWRPFWSVRYNLTSGRRVEPLKRLPTWSDPRVVVVVDPAVHRDLNDDQKARLDGFLAESGLSAVGSLSELKAALKMGYPRLLYWLGHATPEYLQLGDKRIAPGDLRNLLRSFDDRERPEGMLAFLNACQTAEAGSGGSFLDVLHSFGFTGAIATEQQTIDTFANEFGLSFLRGFLNEGKPLGELLHGLRLNSAPLGLLYGAHCPPEIRVIQAGDVVADPAPLPIRESVPDTGVPLGGTPALGRREGRLGRRLSQESIALTPFAPPPSLPDSPYRSLSFYNEGDRALFAGRDADVIRFAATLDRPDTRILILHGESGTGKSSFLRAGVVPYLEEECVGYRFPRRPDGSLLIVQAAKDLIGQISQALLEATEVPLRYDTPDGEAHAVNLRHVLEEAIEGPCNYNALREALRRDVHLLANILTRMATRLPHALVLVLDQTEELFTLARTPEEVAGRDYALRMLQHLVDVTADVKLIISLRTEYYGRLLDHLRAGRRDLTGVRDELLRDFSRSVLIQAITRPTSETPLAPGQPPPREKYGFKYAEGVAEMIADGVLALRSENQDGVLPLVQVICTQLYERETTQPGMDGVITKEDLDGIKGVIGGLEAFAEDALTRSFNMGFADRQAFKGLFSQLYSRQPDGTLTTWMKSRSSLEGQWGRPAPFADILGAAKGVRLLREDELRIEGGEPQRYVRLGHDALAKVAARWDDDLKRGARRRKLVAVAALSSTLAGAMLVLAIAAWRNASMAREGRRQAQLLSASLTFDRGQALCEQGDVAGGLSWMAHALKSVPQDARELDSIVRAGIQAWAPHLSRLRHIFPHKLDVKSVAISPDGRFALTGSSDRTACLWNLSTGECQVIPHEALVVAVAFSHDGRMFSTACWDGKARLWNLNDLTKPSKVLDHPDSLLSLAFSQDDKILLTGDNNGQAHLWEVATSNHTRIPVDRDAEIVAVAFTADGRHAATAGWDTRVRFWDARTGMPSGLPTVTNGAAIRGMALSPDDQSVLVGGMDGYARLWSIATGEMIQEYGPHRGPVYAVEFSPDRTKVVAGTNDGSVTLWDARSGRSLRTLCTHSGWVTSIAFHPKEPLIFTGSGDRTARLWDFKTIENPRVKISHDAIVGRGLFSSNGNSIYTTGDDGKIHLWDVEHLPREVKAGTTRHIAGELGERGFDLALNQPKNLICASAGKQLVLRDSRTLAPKGEPLSHPRVTSCAALSRDGNLIATGCFDEILRLWDVETRKCVGQSILGHWPEQIVMSPDGTSLLACLGNGVARQLDLPTLKASRPDIVHPGELLGGAFSPDGRTIATACGDKNAYLWTLGSQKAVARTMTHPAGVSAITFSPDGRLLLTGCLDGLARLWDVSTGKPIGKPFPHEAGVASVCFSPNGNSVLTTSFDKNAMLWRVPERTLGGAADEVATWIEGLTGLEFREGGDMQVLDLKSWEQRQSGIPAELRGDDR